MAVADPPPQDLNPETGEFETPLKRVIGPGMLLVFVVGDVLGAGIYALVGVVAGETGGAIWTAFLFATILAIMTAFSYAELVTKYPAAGGAATYVDTAFKVPLLTFVIAFTVMCSGIASAATLSKAFAGDYLAEFVELPVVLVAIGFLLIVALINFRGISESIKLNMVLTTIEVLGLVIIIVIGVAALLNGDGDAGRNLDFPEGENVALAIVGGAALSFYALIGFEDAVNVAEETKDPARNFPKALFGGLLIAGVIYLLVTFTASMVVPTQQLTESDGPLLEVVREGPLGVPTKLFAGIALLAVANGALINMIMASRLVYGMSVRGVVPRIFDKVHPRPAHADRGDHLHDRTGHAAGDPRRPQRPGRHDDDAAAVRLRDGERRRARAAARRRQAPALQGAERDPRRLGRDHHLPARPPRVGQSRVLRLRGRAGAVRDCPVGHPAPRFTLGDARPVARRRASRCPPSGP